MDDMLGALLGMDKNKEIFNLHYQVNYLRLLFTHLLQQNPDLAKCMNQEAFDRARDVARDIVRDRFPNFNVRFPDSNLDEATACTPPTPE